MNIAARQKYNLIPFIIFFIAVFTFLVFIVYAILPVNLDGAFTIGVDWKKCFRVAALKVINGENPYLNDPENPNYPGLQNPPWILFFTVPIALLSPALGSAVMFVFTFIGYGLAGYRMKIKPWGTAALLAAQPVWGCASNGNIDWLVALGFTFPPQIGLFFVLLKPQLGIGVVIFWLWQAWHDGGVRQVIKVFGPVTLAFLLSFIIFGLWPLTVFSQRMVDPFNVTSWPLGGALGAILLYFALRKKDPHWAISASPFLTPYLTAHGFAIAFLGLDTVPLIISVAGYWAAFLLRLLCYKIS